MLVLSVTLSFTGCQKGRAEADKPSEGAAEEVQEPESDGADKAEDGELSEEESAEEAAEEKSEEADPDSEIAKRKLTGADETFEYVADYILHHQKEDRNLNYAMDVYKPLKRTGKETMDDIHGEVEAKTAADVMKKMRFYRADTEGATMDLTVYTDPGTLMIDKIISEEFCASGRDMTEFYFDEGKLCYVYQYMTDAYATDFDDGELPGKRLVFANERMTGCIIDDKDVDFKKVAYEAKDYKELDQFTKDQYDQLERDMLNRAYLNYTAARKAPGYAVISGYVGDEFGGYLANVEMTITSKSHHYSLDFTTNGDGYFETRVPINTEDDYGVVCRYGDYPESTVDDIRITPGTIDYSLGVIYMSEAGKEVHERNTYLLNANYSSPKHLGDGEYCVTYDCADKSVDLSPFGIYTKKGKPDKAAMQVIKPGKEGKYKFFVVDVRGVRSGNPMTYELSSSRACVKVYDKNGLVASYQAPAGKAGTVWEVFEVENGELRGLNNLLIETTQEPFLK